MTKSRGIRIRRGTALAFYEEHRDDVTDECMIWPYSQDKDGYGYVWIPGKGHYTRVTVLACITHNGPMPAPGMVAAHGECHNVLCWNGKHLMWKTHAENAVDRYRDGTALVGETNPRSKLTTDAVLDIRAQAAAGEPRKVLALEHGVGVKAIDKIINRQRWGHI